MHLLWTQQADKACKEKHRFRGGWGGGGERGVIDHFAIMLTAESLYGWMN